MSDGTRNVFEVREHALSAHLNGETLLIEPVGSDAIRVRATRNARLDAALGALIDPQPRPQAGIVIDPEGRAARLRHGAIEARLFVVDHNLGPELEIAVVDAESGKTLLAEERPHVLWPPARHYTAEGGGLWRTETRFRAFDGERFYGMGQNQHGRLDQKGCVIDLAQRNTQVSVPFLQSSRGYGLIWNVPGIGRAELVANRTLFAMEGVPQIDYVVIAGDTPAALLERYTALTGRPPPMPDWALGYWQCKLRYKTQEELLAVAREHRKRGLPLDCIVIDFFHWPAMGEWRFDEREWPDPSAMVAELRDMGVECMVSVWPAVNANATTFDTMKRAGHILASARGALDGMVFYDRTPDGMAPLYYYDATHPDARAFVWERVRKGYVAHRIRSFWLDACEPEAYPAHPDNYALHEGDGRAVANIYPFRHLEGFAGAMEREGLDGGVLLTRSAWAGAQRFPVVVWSGDVASTFADLRRQLVAGLNMALSGFPFWTSDIGGFHDGDVNDPAFHELLVRWFQWAAFCPVMRMHGFRQDASRDARFGRLFSFGGADNEIWSFTEEVEAILTRFLHLRARLLPTLRTLSQEAAATGAPLMRPLFFEFPDDPGALGIEDAYTLGPDLLVAPVMEAGARSRAVYLPAGAHWRDAWTGEAHAGGQTIVADAPLERLPLFLRDGASLPIAD